MAFNNPVTSAPTRKDSNEIAVMLNKRKDWVKQDKVKKMGKYGPQRVWVKEKASYLLVTNQLSPESIENQCIEGKGN